MYTCDIFCRVIDNFGDAGISWRLAQSLRKECPFQVRLIIDQVETLAKFVSEVDPNQIVQTSDSVTVVRWDGEFEKKITDCADIVIEAFSCFLPSVYEAAIAKKTQTGKVAVFALDYLTAERYAETSHGLDSPHPRYGYHKTFFFPGFTEKTGGLFIEKGLKEKIHRFKTENGKENFLSRLGADPRHPFTLTVFTYPTVPLESLAAAFLEDPRPMQLILTPGKASETLRSHLEKQSHSHIRIVQAPMLAQTEFDTLLMSSDAVIVRGEDSTVRAQLCAVPFLWTLYPQTEKTHLVKLSAFSALYKKAMSESAHDIWENLEFAINGDNVSPRQWRLFRDHLETLRNAAQLWSKTLLGQSTLTDRLSKMALNRLK